MRFKILFLLIPFFVFAYTSDRALKVYQDKHATESKVALVIGNNNYPGAAKLKNAQNDARDISNILKNRLDFEVITGYNLDEDGMYDKIDIFLKKIRRNKGVGLVYYAGHGVEIDGVNYLVPIGEHKSKKSIKRHAINLNDLLADITATQKNRMNIVILDACRNNPYEGSRGGSKGLAKVSNEKAKGMFIAYSASSGKTSDDNSEGKNGIYTHFLKKHIQTPNVRLIDVFERVRVDVEKATNGQQLPEELNKKRGKFYFNVDLENMNNNSKQESSSFSFSDDLPNLFNLTINTDPKNAKVSILNIKQKYYDGIELEKGKYNIKVSKSGYYTKSGKIDLKSNLTLNIDLKKKISSPIIKKENKAVNNVGSINIAVVMPMSGPIGSYGEITYRGIKLAHELQPRLYNNDKININLIDNKSDKYESEKRLKNSIQDNDFVAIIGALTSTNTMVIGKIAENQSLPIVAPVATNITLTRNKNFMNRVCFSDSYQGEVAAKFIREKLNKKRVVVIENKQLTYSKANSKVFTKTFKNIGGEVLDVIKIKTGDTNFSSLLNRLNSLNPDAVFMPLYSKEAAKIIKQSKDLGLDITFVGTDALISNNMFFDIVKNNIDNIYHTDLFATKMIGINSVSENFAFEYEKKYNETLHPFAALSADAYNVILNAINQCKNPKDKICINNKIKKTLNYKGVSGNINIDKNGNALRTVPIKKVIKNGSELFTTIEP